MTSVGDLFDKTADFVKDAIPFPKDSAPKSAGEHLAKTTEDGE